MNKTVGSLTSLDLTLRASAGSRLGLGTSRFRQFLEESSPNLKQAEPFARLSLGNSAGKSEFVTLERQEVSQDPFLSSLSCHQFGLSMNLTLPWCPYIHLTRKKGLFQSDCLLPLKLPYKHNLSQIFSGCMPWMP